MQAALISNMLWLHSHEGSPSNNAFKSIALSFINSAEKQQGAEIICPQDYSTHKCDHLWDSVMLP